MEGKTVTKVAQSGLDKKTLLKFLHEMLLIRKFEDKAGELYARGRRGLVSRLPPAKRRSGTFSALPNH